MTVISGKISTPEIQGIFAKVAQLVEHNVANVRVVGSNPIFRSLIPFQLREWGFFWRRTQAVRERFAKPSCTSSNLVDASIRHVFLQLMSKSRDGGIGRHKGLKIPRYLILCEFKSRSRHYQETIETSVVFYSPTTSSIIVTFSQVYTH